MKNFQTIYTENHSKVYNYVLNKINHNVVEAEELTNNIFLKAYNHLSEYDDDKSNILTWLISIAKNTVIDFYRKRKIFKVSIHSSDVNENDEIDYRIYDELKNSTTPHMELVRKEQNQKMLNVFRKLPKKQKRVINLYFNHQLKVKDIAKITNTNLNTVKIQLLRGKEFFKLNY